MAGLSASIRRRKSDRVRSAEFADHSPPTTNRAADADLGLHGTRRFFGGALLLALFLFVAADVFSRTCC